MRVRVTSVEPDGETLSMVYGEDVADGHAVCFHLPREGGNQMEALMAAGEEVVADLPDHEPVKVVRETRRGMN